MPVSIDPAFSVYKLVNKLQNQNTILRHRQTMSEVSYEIENSTLVDEARTRVFAGFQRMSKFVPQIARYTEMAAQAESIYVFGVMDVELPSIPNITYVPLAPSDQLSKEWFLVSYGRDYASALATEEITHIDDPDQQRQFNGVWTFNLSLVSILEEWLTNTVDARTLGLTSETMNHERRLKLIGRNLSRLIARSQRTKPTIQAELDTTIKTEVEPPLKQK
ncbi:MAG: DICT sensory domain-containing protein [Chloroflexota bacterium]